MSIGASSTAPPNPSSAKRGPVERFELARLRRSLAQSADEQLAVLLASSVNALDGPATGISLVAVGGYGRLELSPHSDLDVVLIHADSHSESMVADLADRIWYPLWDKGYQIDHAVRSVDQTTLAAAQDLRVALGMLDARHVAGDGALTLAVRSNLLAQWRRSARARLPELAELSRTRAVAVGDLAHLAVPDLKEAKGGLRDATVLSALVATWLVDVPHAELQRQRHTLLDVRDALHLVAGRATDRLRPEFLADVADLLGGDADDIRHDVCEAGRGIAHICDLTWRRVEHLLAAPRRRSGRGPEQIPLVPGVARQEDEIVLTAHADPPSDPVLVLRAAVAAAERRLMLSPVSAVSMARTGADMPVPWPAAARDLLARLLGSGPALVETWETLDQAGAVSRLFPEWSAVRSLAPRSSVHRHTVDRHMVQTCVEAAALVRRVARPDLLFVASLLHDIGKAQPGDHSESGEVLTWQIARRLGYDSGDAATVAMLVRRHLLLIETATRRDLDDPATARAVANVVGTGARLDLLTALTEADARATGPAAWTTWRQQLVSDLVRRVRSELGPTPVFARTPRRRRVPRVTGDFTLLVTASESGARLEFAAPDRIGLLSAVAGSLALLNLPVRRADVHTERGTGVSSWHVGGEAVDEPRLRDVLRRALTGHGLDRVRRASAGQAGPAPSVVVHPDASQSATVLEVRASDRPGLLYDICRVLERLQLDIRSAHLNTVGPQAVDVFYVCGPDGRPLGERAREVADVLGDSLASSPIDT